MDLIFQDGEKVLNKEKEIRKQGIELLEKYGCIHINHYQKQILDLMFNQNKKEFNIYGDDFKVEITPKNIEGNCVLSIKDYDENQKFEHEITIDFSKSELNQVISLLQTISNSL
jgi:hypothetical protein